MTGIYQRPSSAELQAYFDLLFAAFHRSSANSPGPSGTYRFGDIRVKISFAGSGLAPMLIPAISHAAQTSGDQPNFQIFSWDSASTGCELPLLLSQHVQLLKRDWGGYLDSRGGIPHLTGEEIFSTMHIGAAGVSSSVYNSRLRQALFWTEDASLIPYYEQGAPFRAILNWIVNDEAHILVHAGAVGQSDGGVLLAGKGGSGKSTTALACLNAGFSFTSDDYCLVSLNDQPAAFCLYNTAKLVGAADLMRFPVLADQFELRDEFDPKSKPMIFLHQHLPDQIISKLPLKAILLPRLTKGPHSVLRPAGPAAALAAIAPNSIFQLPGAGKQTMAAIGRLSRSLPCLWLELGSDLEEIPGVISAYLKGAVVV